MKQICILQLPIPYCVNLIMVTITRHIFINIFQTKCFSAVKFAMGYEKNELNCDTKIFTVLRPSAIFSRQHYLYPTVHRFITL